MMQNRLIIDPQILSEDLRIRLADELKDEQNLSILCQDSSTLVRLHVVWNSATPIKCLKNLAHDDVPSIRHEVAKNSRTPLEALKKLLQDSSRPVHSAAKHSLRRLGAKV